MKNGDAPAVSRARQSHRRAMCRSRYEACDYGAERLHFSVKVRYCGHSKLRPSRFLVEVTI